MLIIILATALLAAITAVFGIAAAIDGHALSALMNGMAAGANVVLAVWNVQILRSK